MDVLHENLINKAVEVLRSAGLSVSFAAHTKDKRTGDATDVRNRLADLHDAFNDPMVTAILVAVGGTHAIDLIPYIDYDLIRKHPKAICGFSDATIILNAIYARTGVVTYYGPMLFSFAANIDPVYTMDHFRKALFLKSPYALNPAIRWGNYTEMHSNRVNEGYQVIRAGEASGILVGGHVPSLNLLQGTSYLPELEDAVLFIEICERYGKSTIEKLDQYLGSLLLQKGASRIKGLLVGRLYKSDEVEIDDLKTAMLEREELKNIPIILNVDFGHTMPMVTLPVGGRISIRQEGIMISEL
jgi:muramoyltetrapeptide carboxypeptidase LdcA involved in peptidoglycan recycling